MIKDKACPNFRGLNVTEHAAECESVAIISVVFFTCFWEQTLPTSIFRLLWL